MRWPENACDVSEIAAGVILGGGTGAFVITRHLKSQKVAPAAGKFKRKYSIRKSLTFRRKRFAAVFKLSDLTRGPIIGSGSFGEVERATWKGTHVALKIAPPDIQLRSDNKTWLQEASILQVRLGIDVYTSAPTQSLILLLKG